MIRAAFALIPLALLSACNNAAEGDSGTAAAAAVTGAAAATAEQVWCARDGAKDFTQDCTLERSSEENRPAFVVRHPDGKFRRLVTSEDGQHLLSADGADQSQSARKADRWEVILGGDRYVVPVKADAPKP